MYLLYLLFASVSGVRSESVGEAVERVLSRRSDSELLALRNAAVTLAKQLEAEYLGRAIVTDVTPECDVKGCVLARSHASDHLFDLALGAGENSADRAERALGVQ